MSGGERPRRNINLEICCSEMRPIEDNTCSSSHSDTVSSRRTRPAPLDVAVAKVSVVDNLLLGDILTCS